MKWDEDLPRTEGNEPKLLTAMIACIAFMIAAGVFIFLMYRGPTIHILDNAYGAERSMCDTATEAQLQEVIDTEPSRLLARLSGSELAAFFAKLQASQYMTGTLSRVDVLYIVTTKDGGNVLLLFFVDKCLIKAIPASKTVIEAMLVR